MSRIVAIELQIIQELTLALSKQHQVAGHRDQVLNDSFRRQRVDLSKRSAEAEARVAELQVSPVCRTSCNSSLHSA